MRTGHVGLNVTDLDRSVGFYTKVFGFQVTGSGDGFTFLGFDGVPHVTLWRQSGEGFAKDRSGLHHLAFQVDSIDAVRQAEGVLKALGAEFTYDGVVPHGEGRASGGIFFTDPDGIRLEIYAPSGAEEATAPNPGAPTCGFF
ncbi:VOC family protein [Nonomuraea sediminis]|uniref:VOC family protein n=1 Tax=Nonomuraea sediminis TaxID=2835864 RepID=UPI001BDC570E|nr:VOC family protein [Nonomuraea sediminis]